MERLARLIQREVAAILNQTSNALVTVTRTRVSRDLSIAYIYLSVLGDRRDARQAAFRRIQDAGGEIRSELAGRIRHQVRKIPELRFFLDESQIHAENMEALFGQIREEREARSAALDMSDKVETETDDGQGN